MTLKAAVDAIGEGIESFTNGLGSLIGRRLAGIIVTCVLLAVWLVLFATITVIGALVINLLLYWESPWVHALTVVVAALFLWIGWLATKYA